jgi:hypothetical protein
MIAPESGPRTLLVEAIAFGIDLPIDAVQRLLAISRDIINLVELPLEQVFKDLGDSYIIIHESIKIKTYRKRDTKREQKQDELLVETPGLGGPGDILDFQDIRPIVILDHRLTVRELFALTPADPVKQVVGAASEGTLDTSEAHLENLCAS